MRQLALFRMCAFARNQYPRLAATLGVTALGGLGGFRLLHDYPPLRIHFFAVQAVLID